MPTSTFLTRLVRELRQSAAGRRLDGTPDADLLERFRADGDPEAFEAIVRRYGPGVLSACRRVLSSSADVEDAFQATFLVLLRNALSIRRRQALGGWLAGVAHRVALKALEVAARRQRVEQRPRPATEEGPDLSWREACAILHEELDRLPDTYRLPLILCYLDGRSRDEAAQQLGVGTDVLRGRLERGRDRLRSRLLKRGVALSAGLLAVVANSVTAGGPPEHLVRATLKAAATGNIPAAVAALVHGATPTMTLGKFKLLAGAVLAVALISGGISLRMLGAPPDADPPRTNEAPPAEPAKDQATETVECQGRVLDPEGKAAVGAKVTCYQWRPKNESADFMPEPAAGTTDRDGRFRFPATVRKAAPNRGSPPVLVLTASVPGYGPAALEVRTPADLKDRTLRLVKDDVPLRGRILDLEGKPVAGVTVRPVAVVVNEANDLGPWIKARKTKDWRGLASEFHTNLSFPAAVAGLTQKAVTDDAGKFTLSGFGRERVVVLRVDGPTVETRLLNVLTRAEPAFHETYTRPSPFPELARPQTNTFHGAVFDFVPGVGTTVEGVVSDRDSGKALAGVKVRCPIVYDFGWGEDELATTTDAEGRYRLAGLPRRERRQATQFRALEFVPPAGQPYFPGLGTPAVPDLDKPAKLDVTLKRGVLVKGKVTDRATGKPVEAVVEYFTFPDNPQLRGLKGLRGARAVTSRKDGSFALVALPGRGVVAARTDEMRRGTYLYGQGAEKIKGLDEKAGSLETVPYILFPAQFDAVAEIDPDAKAESVACDLEFDPGKTVKGMLLDPDGKPLSGVHIRGPFWSRLDLRDVPAADFAIAAVNPSRPEAYFFQHEKKKLAGFVILKGDEPEGFAVKLQPAGTVTGRVVNQDGEPLADATIAGRLEAGQLNMAAGWNGFFWSRTDAEGRFTIECLPAGVRLGAQVQHKDIIVAELFKGVTLQPGEGRSLGDVKVKRLSSE
jgi:RNA polymerase sigma factor (sigma-70 family)